MSLPPIGVTVVTPSYKHLEKYAVRSFKKQTGLEVLVLQASNKQGFLTKLNLDKLCGKRRIVFFDVDTRIVQKASFGKFEEFCAVNDPAIHIPHTFPKDDCERFGIDPYAYFNSGFFLCDLGNPLHRKLFQKARQLYRTVKNRPVDHTDQFWLNYAAHKIGLRVSWMPFVMNMYTYCVRHGGVPFYPRRPIVIHAAGYHLKDKKKALDAMEFLFGGHVPMMQDSAVRAAYTKTFEV